MGMWFDSITEQDEIEIMAEGAKYIQCLVCHDRYLDILKECPMCKQQPPQIGHC